MSGGSHLELAHNMPINFRHWQQASKLSALWHSELIFNAMIVIIMMASVDVESAPPSNVFVHDAQGAHAEHT